MAQRKTWSTEQDDFITEKVRYNQKVQQKDRLKWGDIADQLNKKFPESGRTGKQCRQRWHNQLDPSISHRQWSIQQQKKLFELQKKLGNKWAQIANKLDGRTDNNVKNYFYSTLRKSLRKINSFIMSNKNQLKTAKQFKQSSLSKLLAVADHKFDKKINIKKDTVESQAIQIKNLLIDLTHVEINDPKYKKSFISLTQKFQQFNKNCKKKKCKRKQDPQQFKNYDQSLNQIDQQNADQQADEQDELSFDQQQIQQIEQQKPRNKNKPKTKSIKKESNQSKKNVIIEKTNKISKDQKVKKQKLIKNQKKQSFSLVNKNNSSKNSYLQGNRFHDFGRSSMDLGKSKQHLCESFSGSQLFMGFNTNNEEDKKQVQLVKKQSNRVLRQQSNLSFFQGLPQMPLKKNESNKSFLNEFGIIDEVDFVKDLQRPRFFSKKSSIRQLPLLCYQESKLPSTLNFNVFLDNSIKYEPSPQLSKLRSYSKKNDFGGNFSGQFQFGNDL